MMPFLAPMNQFPHAPPLNESESKYDFFTHLRIPRAFLAHKTSINYFPISLENEASSLVLSPGGCEADPDTCAQICANITSPTPTWGTAPSRASSSCSGPTSTTTGRSSAWPRTGRASPWPTSPSTWWSPCPPSRHRQR